MGLVAKGRGQLLGRLVPKAEVRTWLLRNAVTVACWQPRCLGSGQQLRGHPGKPSVCQESLDFQGGEFCPTGTPSSLVTEDLAGVQAASLYSLCVLLGKLRLAFRI